MKWTAYEYKKRGDMKILIGVLMGMLRKVSLSCWSIQPVSVPLLPGQPDRQRARRVMRLLLLLVLGQQ